MLIELLRSIRSARDTSSLFEELGYVNDHPTAAYCLDLFAVSAAARGELERAALILGATEAVRERMGAGPDEDEEEIRARAGDFLDREAPQVEAAWAQGRELDLEAAFELADRAPGTA